MHPGIHKSKCKESKIDLLQPQKSGTRDSFSCSSSGTTPPRWLLTPPSDSSTLQRPRFVEAGWNIRCLSPCLPSWNETSCPGLQRATAHLLACSRPSSREGRMQQRRQGRPPPGHQRQEETLSCATWSREAVREEAAADHTNSLTAIKLAALTSMRVLLGTWRPSLQELQRLWLLSHGVHSCFAVFHMVDKKISQMSLECEATLEHFDLCMWLPVTPPDWSLHWRLHWRKSRR